MTTPPRRLSPFSLSIGLGVAMLANIVGSSSAYAAPPDDADAEAESGDEEAAAPGEDIDADAAAPEQDVAPEEPAATELAAPAPSGDVEDIEDIEAEDGSAQGSEAFPPEEKIQLPVAVGDKHSITYTSLLGPRINPLGLEERLWIGYQYRLYDKDKTILNGSNLGIFFRPILSPAIALVGATVQVQPAAVLRLRATYSYVAYFSTFQYFQSYQSPHDDFSEARLNAQRDAGENYVSTGHQIELEALIQARYKGLVLRSTTIADYNSMQMRGDDDLFYDVRIDALVPNNGWVIANDTDLMWMQDLKGPRHATVLVGARASTVAPLYPDSVYEPGDVISNPNGPQFKLGPSLGYIFYDRPERNPKFNRPTLLLMPQWNLQHRWRTGRDVSTAMPTIVMAFVVSGQLWGKN